MRGLEPGVESEVVKSTSLTILSRNLLTKETDQLIQTNEYRTIPKKRLHSYFFIHTLAHIIVVYWLICRITVLLLIKNNSVTVLMLFKAE